MSLSDNTFNKVVTIILLVYALSAYTVAYITNRPLDLYNLFVLVAPLLNNTIHLVTRANVQQKQIEADVTKATAQIAQNGKA